MFLRKERKFIFTPTLRRHLITYKITTDKAETIRDFISVYNENDEILCTLPKTQAITVQFISETLTIEDVTSYLEEATAIVTQKPQEPENSEINIEKNE